MERGGKWKRKKDKREKKGKMEVKLKRVISNKPGERRVIQKKDSQERESKAKSKSWNKLRK